VADNRNLIIAGYKTGARRHLQNTLQSLVICLPTQY